VSSVSNGLYFLTLLLVSCMPVICTSKGMSKKFGVRVIYTSKGMSKKVWSAHYTLGVRYLYIKRDVEKVWSARYTLGAHYISNSTVNYLFFWLSHSSDQMPCDNYLCGSLTNSAYINSPCKQDNL